MVVRVYKNMGKKRWKTGDVNSFGDIEGVETEYGSNIEVEVEIVANMILYMEYWVIEAIIIKFNHIIGL